MAGVKTTDFLTLSCASICESIQWPSHIPVKPEKGTPYGQHRPVWATGNTPLPLARNSEKRFRKLLLVGIFNGVQNWLKSRETSNQTSFENIWLRNSYLSFRAVPCRSVPFRINFIMLLWDVLDSFSGTKSAFYHGQWSIILFLGDVKFNFYWSNKLCLYDKVRTNCTFA